MDNFDQKLDATLPDDLKEFSVPVGMGTGEYFRSCAHLKSKTSGGDKDMADKEKVKKLEEKIENLEEVCSQAEEKEKDYQEKIESLETQAKTVEELKEENEKLKEQVEQLEKENEELKKQLDELKEYKDKDYYYPKQEADKLKEENKNLKQTNEDLQTDLETKDGRIAELEKEKHQMETAERTKERVGHIKEETGLDFSEEKIEKIASEVQDLDEGEFKDYVEDLVDTVLASIPKEIVQRMKKIQEEEPELTLAETINKAYKLTSKDEGMNNANKAQSLSSLNQDDPENLEEKYSNM